MHKINIGVSTAFTNQEIIPISLMNFHLKFQNMLYVPSHVQFPLPKILKLILKQDSTSETDTSVFSVYFCILSVVLGYFKEKITKSFSIWSFHNVRKWVSNSTLTHGWTVMTYLSLWKKSYTTISFIPPFPCLHSRRTWFRARST